MAQVVFINFIVSLILAGLIWTIQLVHYPSFHFISKDKFSSFMSFHVKSITFLVGPLMMIELITAIYLVLFRYNILSLLSIITVLFIWLSTILLSVPCHNKLAKAYDKKIIDRLVLTNWPRTVMWTVKAGLSLLILNQ